MTIEDMQELLDRLGVEYYNTRGSEIQGACPAHFQRTGHEDHNPSWWINSETGAHICFSCHFKGGLQSLVSYVNGIDFEQAKDWLSQGETNLTKALERLEKKKEPVFKDVPELTEANLAAFISPPQDMLKERGLTAEAASFYGIQWDKQKNCWILPIRDPFTGKLWGWQEKGSNRYFKNYPTGVQKSQALFGYGNYLTGTMIVVESPLDVARLLSVGITGGVSTYGSAISVTQLNLIRGAENIIFAMDNDDSGRSSSENLLQWSIKLGFEARFFNYKDIDVKDIGGMSKVEILMGLESAKHSILGEKALW
jgi:DNA primase